MGATVNVNMRTVVHASSGGIATAFPDVCKTPSPAGPIPIPYPNIAKSGDTADGSKDVKIDGNPIMLQGSNFATSTGDEAGTAGGGIVSNTTKGKAEFINYSFDVKIEGKSVPRLGDMMLQNKMSSPNAPPMPEVQAPLIAIPLPDAEEQEAKLVSVKFITREEFEK
jgi:uncharacterized Zn-binding protein involved in type VI secretion